MSSEVRNVGVAALLITILSVAAALVAQQKTQISDFGPASVQRGQYLVSSIGCADCHAPKKLGPAGPEPDMTRFLSGHPEGTPVPPPPALPPGPWTVTTTWDLTAWSGPWGVSYAINLTPDENTGIGTWSQETFMKAIRTGRHMGVSRPILPPMPWWIIRNLSDDDLRSVFLYLKSLPPVRNRVPEPVFAPEPTH